jgi:hypothetical protein
MVEKYIFDYVDEPMFVHTHFAASIDCFSKKEVQLLTYENAIIDPNSSLGQTQIVQHIKEIDISNYQYEHNPVIFLGTWYNVWGHLLTDTLSRFWFVESCEYFNSQISEYDILYFTEDNNFPFQFYELLDLIGINRNRLRRINEPVLCNKIICPDESIFVEKNEKIALKDADKKDGLYFYTKEFKCLIDRIKSNVKNECQFEKIFFTVPASKKFIGLTTIERFFKSQGFKIINPANLTFLEQLSYLSGCKIFCTIEGSISFNTLFLDSKTDVVLLRKLPYIVPYQFMINQISDSRIIYIDSHISFFCDKNYPYLGPFFLYPSENLCKYLCIEQTTSKISILVLLKYFIRAIKLQKERSFLNNVVWDIDMYYFTKACDLINKGLSNRIWMKLINKA